MRDGVLDDRQKDFPGRGLAVGDRVRLRDGCASQRHRPGDTGRVVAVSRAGRYYVRMDGAKALPLLAFEPSEVEPAGAD